MVATVCWSYDDARAVVAAGGTVVLVTAPTSPVPDLHALRGAGPGRVAVLLADPDDPATAGFAAEMCGELGRVP